MTDGKLFTTGVSGAIVAAVCCFTPVLVVVLGGLGLAAFLGWLDLVLLPALAVFIGIAVVSGRSILRRRVAATR